MGVMDAPVLIHLPVYASGEGSTSGCGGVGSGGRRLRGFGLRLRRRLRWDVAVEAGGPCRQGRRTTLSAVGGRSAEPLPEIRGPGGGPERRSDSGFRIEARVGVRSPDRGSGGPGSGSPGGNDVGNACGGGEHPGGRSSVRAGAVPERDVPTWASAPATCSYVARSGPSGVAYPRQRDGVVAGRCDGGRPAYPAV